MSVNPGFGGQKFISRTLPKIKKLRSLIDQSGKDIRLEVDGGINEQNVKAISTLAQIHLSWDLQFLTLMTIKKQFLLFVTLFLSFFYLQKKLR